MGDNEMATYIIYIWAMVVCCFFAYIARKTGNRKYIWADIVVLTIIAGFRGPSVGKDTSHYIEIFELISSNDPRLSWIGLEKTYTYICRFLLSTWNNYTFIFFLTAFITYAAILLRFWDFRAIGNYSWMVFCFYTMHFFASMNITRQFCAVAIVFWGTRFLEKDKYKYFFLTIICGCLFHKSALIGILFYVFELLRRNKLEKKQILFVMACIALVPVYGEYLLITINKYMKYFMASNFNIGIMLPFKLVLLFFSGYGLKKCIYMKNRKAGFTNIYARDLQETIGKVRIYYAVGIALTSIGYFFTFMERIGLMFYLFEAVYMGMIVKIRKDRNMYRILVFLLFVYVFIVDLISDGQGVIPYTVFWQG